MASYTPNYNLKKPADGDYYDIADDNGNMDKIDTALNTLNNKITFDITISNLNDPSLAGGHYLYEASATGNPSTTAGRLIQIKSSASSWGGQIAVPNSSTFLMYARMKTSSGYGDWEQLAIKSGMGEIVQTVNDQYNYLKVVRLGNFYIVNYCRKVEVSNGTNAYTIDSRYAPDAQVAAWTFYKQTSGYALCQGLLQSDGKIILQAAVYNENLAGNYTFMYTK